MADWAAYLTSGQVSELLGLHPATVTARVSKDRSRLQALGYRVLEGPDLEDFRQATRHAGHSKKLAVWPWPCVLRLAQYYGKAPR